MPPLDRTMLEEAVMDHMRFERDRALDDLRDQLRDDVDYVIKTPAHPEDPTPYGHFIGADTYIDMWERLYKIFETYDIEVQDVVVDAERGRAFVQLQVTAVPFEEWNGLPAGEPIRWWPAAIVEFDESGKMLRETVYGSFPPIMEGYKRMREYHGLAPS